MFNLFETLPAVVCGSLRCQHGALRCQHGHLWQAAVVSAAEHCVATAFCEKGVLYCQTLEICTADGIYLSLLVFM